MDRKGHLVLEQELKVFMVDNKVVVGVQAGGAELQALADAPRFWKK